MFTGILGVKSRIFYKTSSMIFINDSVCLECRGTLYISGIRSFRFCHDYHLICSISSLHRPPPGNFVYCLASMPMPQWNQVESQCSPTTLHFIADLPRALTSVVVVKSTDVLLRGWRKWVYLFEMHGIPTRRTGECWLEQISTLHGTPCWW